MKIHTKTKPLAFAAAALGLACAARADVSFTAWTIPAADGLIAEAQAARTGGEWRIAVTAKNAAATNVTFKLVLEAAPGFAATRYLIPGVLYNGNEFVKAMQGNDKRLASLDIPTGWEKDGEPWTFSYDRCSIPSCTVSENTNEVFALFASVSDAASHVSSCSLVRNADGSFRHRILWPVTEAPVSYSNKRTFTARRDTYLTLKPGETFTALAFACTARPPWPDYGFAAVFPVAWRLLKPDVPSQLPLAEVMRLDKAFQDWSRRRNEEGSWYMPYLVDMTLLLGNYRKRAPKDLTIEDIEKDPSKNYWENDELEKSKKLKPGEYLYGPGSGIGFSAQSFQLARLSVEYGLRNNSQKDIDFGLEVFRSWIRVRQKPSGHFGSKWKTLKWKDASEVGWALAELSRLCILLKAHGLPSAEFEESARRQADAILRVQRRDGNLGSKWLIADGKVIEWGGDCGGYVLMGLARYWQLTRSDRVRAAIRPRTRRDPQGVHLLLHERHQPLRVEGRRDGLLQHRPRGHPPLLHRRCDHGRKHGREVVPQTRAESRLVFPLLALLPQWRLRTRNRFREVQLEARRLHGDRHGTSRARRLRLRARGGPLHALAPRRQSALARRGGAHLAQRHAGLPHRDAQDLARAGTSAGREERGVLPDLLEQVPHGGTQARAPQRPLHRVGRRVPHLGDLRPLARRPPLARPRHAVYNKVKTMP